jgi:hypothetical protein
VVISFNFVFSVHLNTNYTRIIKICNKDIVADSHSTNSVMIKCWVEISVLTKEYKFFLFFALVQNQLYFYNLPIRFAS